MNIHVFMCRVSEREIKAYEKEISIQIYEWKKHKSSAAAAIKMQMC
jgi:hypothetical protein